MKRISETLARFIVRFPWVLISLAIIAVAGILPDKYQRELSARIASLERLTGIFSIGLISMVAYWLVRLIEII